MNRNRAWTALGVLLLLAFAGFAFASFRRNLTPYVSFEDARRGDATMPVVHGWRFTMRYAAAVSAVGLAALFAALPRAVQARLP